jgi:hypothetical protein
MAQSGNPLTSYALTDAAPFVNNGDSSMGWTAGVAIDYAFTDSVFGRSVKALDNPAAGPCSPPSSAF